MMPGMGTKDKAFYCLLKRTGDSLDDKKLTSVKFKKLYL